MVIDRLYPALHQLSLPRTRWIIIGLHVLLLAALFAHQGILTDKEAVKYTGCAEAILRGDLADLTGNYLKYSTYVLFLVPFAAIGKVSLAIAAQVLIGIVAADALARFTERFTRNVGLGQLAMALFLLCPFIQTWVLSLYTEHLFTCLAILFIERIDRERRLTAAVLVLGVLTLLARPTGMFFVVPAMAWKWSEKWHGPKRAAVITTSCALVILVAIGIPRIERAQLAPIASGQVVAGVGGHGAEGFDGRTILEANRHLIRRVGFAEWTLIGMQRVLSLLVPTRPHYSAMHNGVNAMFLLLYPLALVGLRRTWKDGRSHLALAVLCTYTLLIALTHDEWSGRFLVPLLPLFFILAAAAAAETHRDPTLEQV